MADTQNRSVVGVHYRVGRKIGEGSFGVIFEGAQLPWLGSTSPQTAMVQERIC